MTMQNLIDTISTACTGATMCRRSNSNFLAVPGDVVDGVQTYYAVKVSALLSKDTKVNKAFDFDAAVAEYAEFAAKQAEKAATPKKSSGADPAKQAAKEARKAALTEWMKDNPGEHTCTEVKEAMPEVYGECVIMTVGSDAKELFTAGVLDKRTEKGKNYYFYKGE